MPRKVKRERDDNVSSSNNANARDDVVQEADGSAPAARPDQDQPPRQANVGASQTVLPSPPENGQHRSIMEQALLRTEGLMGLWYAECTKAAVEPSSLLVNSLNSQELVGGSDNAGYESRHWPGANVLGTIDVLFDEGRQAVLAEYDGRICTAVLARLPSDAAEDSPSVGDPDAETSSGGHPPSVSDWYLGDVVAFSPEGSGGTCCVSTWVGFHLPSIKDAADRVHGALSIASSPAVWSLVIQAFTGKPGIAQLTAFFTIPEQNAKSASITMQRRVWTRLLRLPDGTTLLPHDIASQGGHRTDDGKAAISHDEPRPPHALRELERQEHALAFLVASGLISLQEGCPGMHTPVRDLIWEFVASPLFIQFIMFESDEHFVSNREDTIRPTAVPQLSAASLSDNQGARGGDAEDDAARERAASVAQMFLFFSECVWIPQIAVNHASGGVNAVYGKLWTRAALGLASALHVVLRRASVMAAKGPANESQSPSTAGGAAASRIATFGTFQQAAALFIGWLTTSNANGTPFERHSVAPVSPSSLAQHLRAPSSWQQWVAWDQQLPSSSSRQRVITDKDSAEYLTQLPRLGPADEVAALPSDMLISSSSLLQCPSLVRYASLKRAYALLFTPLGKALRCEFAEQRARVASFVVEHALRAGRIASNVGESTAPDYVGLQYLVAEVNLAVPSPIVRRVSTSHHHVQQTRGGSSSMPVEEQQRRDHHILHATALTASHGVALQLHGIPRFSLNMPSMSPSCSDFYRTASMGTETSPASPSAELDSVMGCIVVEMGDTLHSEPIPFPCICHRRTRVSSTATTGESGDELVVHFLNQNTAIACSLLQTVAEARRVFEDGVEESQRFPRACLMFAREIPASDAAVAASTTSALGRMQLMKHVVLLEQQHQIAAAVGAGATRGSAPLSIFDASCQQVRLHGGGLTASSSRSAADAQLPISAHQRRVPTQQERDLMRRCTALITSSMAHIIHDLHRSGTGVHEAVGSATGSGSVMSGLHTVEGVVGSGKSAAASLVAAVQGVTRRESRSLYSATQTSVLEHVSLKAATQSRAFLNAKGTAQNPTSLSSATYSLESAERRAELATLTRTRFQQVEEFHRCHQGLIVRSPIVLMHTCSSAFSHVGVHHEQVANATSDGVNDPLSPRMVRGSALRLFGAVRAQRAPFIAAVRRREAELLDIRDQLFSLEKDTVRPSPSSQEGEEGSLHPRGGVEGERQLIPLVMDVLMKSAGPTLHVASANGSTLPDALRVLFGTHRVLLAKKKLPPPPGAASGGGHFGEPSPPRYVPSSTTTGLLERKTQQIATQQGIRVGAAPAQLSSPWNTDDHGNLAELQQQLIRSALAAVDLELVRIAQYQAEVGDYVASFEASQRADVVVMSEAEAAGELLALTHNSVGPRTSQGPFQGTGLVLDDLDQLLDEPFFAAPAPSFLFASMSLERLRSPDLPDGWGVAGAVAEHIRHRLLQHPTSSSTSVSTTRLGECLRMRSKDAITGSSMLLPLPVMNHRSTVTASTVNRDMADSGGLNGVPCWPRQVVLWNPSSASTPEALNQFVSSLRLPSESDDNIDDAANGKTLQAVFGPNPVVSPTSPLAEASSTRLGSDTFFACVAAAELMRYRESIGLPSPSSASPVPAIAVIVPSVLLLDVQRAVHAATAQCRVRGMFHFPFGDAPGVENDDGPSPDRVVLVGDLGTLQGFLIDVALVVPGVLHTDGAAAPTKSHQRVCAPYHCGSSDLWLWRACTRPRCGFAIVSHYAPQLSALSSPRPSAQALALFRNFVLGLLTTSTSEATTAAHLNMHHVAAPPSRSVQLDVATRRRPNPFDVLRFHCPEHPDVSSHVLVGRDGPTPPGQQGDAQRRRALVASVGTSQCRSVCMHRFTNCSHPAHRCINRCHVATPTPFVSVKYLQTSGEAPNTSGDATSTAGHRHCPFPCSKSLPCGHRCLATCGDESCPPCSFVGWVELPCGQMVVSGMNGKDVQYSLFPHFMCVPCGQATATAVHDNEDTTGTVQARICSATVHVQCGRCGAKQYGPCHDTEQSAEWPCASCEAEAAKVRLAFGLPEPSTSHQGGGTLGSEQNAEDDQPPWPDAAVEALQKQLSFLRQKSLLLEKRTALEAAAKGSERNPDFVAETARVASVRQEQELLEAGWVQRSADAKARWASSMQGALDGQREWKDYADVQHRQVMDVLMQLDE